MKLDEMLRLLGRIKEQHGGDDEVVVVGLYGERSHFEIEVARVRDERTSCVEIRTDLGGG